jgi:calcineurin-like phosphoesterase
VLRGPGPGAEAARGVTPRRGRRQRGELGPRRQGDHQREQHRPALDGGFLTLGNHAFDAEGHEGFLEHEKRVVRPANLDGHLPGRGWGVFEVEGVSVGVTNVLGQVFVDRTSVSPFEVVDRAASELEALGADLVLVDAHAEATSEK